MQLSASSAALDLALSHNSKESDLPSNGWPSFARHRPAQHSLPMTIFVYEAPQTNGSPNGGLSQSGVSSNGSPGNMRRYDRHSMDLTFSPLGESIKPAGLASPSNSQQAPPKLQSSYSTNDIPTMKTTNGISTTTHAQQHFHNHNASLGRIPMNGVNNRHSRELSATELPASTREVPATNLQPFQSGLQGSAQPFGPPLSTSAGFSNIASPTAMAPYQLAPAFYSTYGMHLNMGMNNQMFHPQTQFGAYPNFPPQPQSRIGDVNQARAAPQRRNTEGEGKWVVFNVYKIC